MPGLALSHSCICARAMQVKDGYLSVVSDSLAWKEATFAAAMMTPVLSTIGSCLGV